MLSKTLLGITACSVLAGCTNSWIVNPSPSTRELVNDLRLEGFECNARFSEVECVQIEPLRNKQPSICDSKKGCVAQPDVLIYNRYHITQKDTGIPGITHDLIEKTDTKLISGSKVIQN